MTGSIRLLIAGLTLTAASAWAKPPKAPGREVIEQVQRLEEQAKSLGPWAREAQVIIEAQTLVFQQNGWDSEPDRFALNLINSVSQIAPWKAADREEVFFNDVQTRYELTHEQRTLLKQEIRTEAMVMTMKHFKEIVPIVLEITQTRAKQEPFTPEQVQRWSRLFKPIMDDALQSVQRVSQKLQRTMTEDQRKMLERDMKAVLKRHHDIEKMVKDWQAGNWNPTQWGLQNDPIHAAAMHEYRLKQAQRDGLVELAELKHKPDLKATATDQSAWERYVLWFCNYYVCDDRQRGIARAILKDCTRQAIGYLRARGRAIAEAEQLSKTAEREETRRAQAAEVARLKKPIAEIFQRLCDRLERQVLTTRQKQLLDPEKSKKAREQATREVAAKKG